MLTKQAFSSLLDSKGTLILDGALATELETRGHNLNHPLWSAKLLQDDPDSIEAIHLDYFLAGADVAITASYQATTQGLAKHFGLSEQDGQDLIKNSVMMAVNARTQSYASGISHKRLLLIAGSVGPYGAFLADGSEYRGDYVRSAQDFQDFHRPRVQALIEAGVDLLALETMPSLVEITALLNLLEAEFPTAIAWLSCTTRDSGHLSDGTPWKTVLDLVNLHGSPVIAFGINCVPLHIVTETLRHIRPCTQLPLLCYPNSGEIWNAETKTWIDMQQQNELSKGTQSIDEQSPSTSIAIDPRLLAEWRSHGARLIGGCCRTGPDFIKAIYQDHNRIHGS